MPLTSISFERNIHCPYN